MCQSHVSNRNLAVLVVGLICLSFTAYTVFTPLRFLLAATATSLALYWHLAINDAGTTPTSIPLHDAVPIIDTVLSQWQPAIGSAYPAYRNHVYRVFHLIRAQLPECDTNEELYQQVAIAAVFHDLGIWSDKHADGRLQADYLAPSAKRAMDYLDANDKPQSWRQPITLMITEHHKIMPFESGSHVSVVEVFRRADTIDASFGLMRNGIRRSLHASLLQRWPRDGFLTKMLLPITIQWEKDHPFTPLPIFKW